MKKFIFLLIATPIFFIGCEDPCVDLVCDQGVAQEDANGICFCDCIAGFTGERCDQAIVDDPCEDVTCENGGTCNSDGTCDCLDGFMGDNCEIQDPCFGVACTNNGTFNIVDGICTCECNEGFAGDDCSLPIETTLLGNWNAVDMCQIYYYGDSIPYIATIQQNMMGNYEIVNFGAIDTTLAFGATIEGNMITVPIASVSDSLGTLLVNGNGILSEGRDTIIWEYMTEYEEIGMVDPVVDNCTGIWVKQ